MEIEELTEKLKHGLVIEELEPMGPSALKILAELFTHRDYHIKERAYGSFAQTFMKLHQQGKVKDPRLAPLLIRFFERPEPKGYGDRVFTFMPAVDISVLECLTEIGDKQIFTPLYHSLEKIRSTFSRGYEQSQYSRLERTLTKLLQDTWPSLYRKVEGKHPSKTIHLPFDLHHDCQAGALDFEILIEDDFSFSSHVQRINLSPPPMEWSDIRGSLGYCSIERVDLTELSDCPRLIVLSLAGNHIQTLDLTPLQQCTTLRTLNLRNNLSFINLSPLAHHEALETLLLNYDPILKEYPDSPTLIDITPLFECPKLETLTIEGADGILANPTLKHRRRLPPAIQGIRHRIIWEAKRDTAWKWDQDTNEWKHLPQ